jgi:hypothetical protein
VFQFVDADAGVMWFDDAIAPGFEHASWSDVVEDMAGELRTCPVVALAFLFAVNKYGVAAYFVE